MPTALWRPQSERRRAAAKGKAFVYRVHDQPDTTKLTDLAAIARTFGYRLKTQGSATEINRSINKMLQDVKGKGEENFISMLAIRSMAKAIYTTENIGHYGLGFDYYTHFTSPIRRYPDMMVHRLLERYLDGGRSVNREKLEEQCNHSSAMEQLAANAERSSIKYKQVEYMADHLGEEFEGMISGVTEWGLYVEICENKCEGLVPMRDLADDYYDFDEKNYCLRGRRRGNVYRLGDIVRVRVANTNLDRKQLDFVIVDPLAPTRPAQDDMGNKVSVAQALSGKKNKGNKGASRRGDKKKFKAEEPVSADTTRRSRHEKAKAAAKAAAAKKKTRVSIMARRVAAADGWARCTCLLLWLMPIPDFQADFYGRAARVSPCGPAFCFVAFRLARLFAVNFPELLCAAPDRRVGRKFITAESPLVASPTMFVSVAAALLSASPAGAICSCGVAVHCFCRLHCVIAVIVTIRASSAASTASPLNSRRVIPICDVNYVCRRKYDYWQWGGERMNGIERMGRIERMVGQGMGHQRLKRKPAEASNDRLLAMSVCSRSYIRAMSQFAIPPKNHFVL